MKTLLISPGQFICLTASDVFVALLAPSELARYWDTLEKCDDTRAPEVYRAQLFKRVFGQDVLNALPAGHVDALHIYCEHYEGLHAEIVKGICACILTGTPFSRDGDKPDGGTRIPQAPKPTRPRSGGRAKALTST